ncbi:MAG: RNA polymerase sigma factor, partial [Myxococcota bacterium]
MTTQPPIADSTPAQRSTRDAPSADGGDPHQALVDRALNGDRAGLDALCRSLAGPIYRLALRMLAHPEDAEDATQEVLVKVATHLSSFRGDSRVLTWAYTIATRHLLKRRKGRREHEVRTAHIAALVDSGLAITTSTSQPAGDAKVLEREVRLACTQNMLLSLSRQERIALILVEILGASATVGADICEVRTETFRQRLSRARAKLRPILEERCGLSAPSLPCQCRRQAAAKQKACIDQPRHWTKLPVLSDEDVARAQDQLQTAHRWGAVFAWDPPIAPPRTLWASIAPRHLHRTARAVSSSGAVGRCMPFVWRP